jgi:hypothetical protein
VGEHQAVESGDQSPHSKRAFWVLRQEPCGIGRTAGSGGEIMRECFSDHMDAIVARWADLTLEDFAKDRKIPQSLDRFRNPAGFVVRENLRLLLEVLLDGADEGGMAGRLDAIIRLRTAQGLDAGRAVSFVSSLKGIIRQELGACARMNQSFLAELEGRIDTLALTAADLFRRCREQIGEIRIREAQRRTWVSRRIAAKHPAGGHA